MKNLKKFTYAIVSMIFIQIIFLASVELVIANTSIPDKFNKNLDLDQIYIYNVTDFNTTKPLEWRDVDWFAPTKGFVNITPGGQLKVNFTGFYEKDPNDIFNLFESPMPYMNIEFIENRSGVLITNTTLANVSNGEAAMNLLLGYNAFQSGFLIPISNFNNLTQDAAAQEETAWMNATVTIQETSETISFDFKQKSSSPQETKCIYDKVSGLLVYTNTSFGNYTLEMTLTNIPNLPSGDISIPGFQPYILVGSVIIISIIYITNLRKKK
jgi:hypothetical protein